MLGRRHSEVTPSAPPLDLDKCKLISSSSVDSDTLPSAPLPETPTFKNPVSLLELTISASCLLNLDQITRSDPLCVLFLLDSTTLQEWVEIGRTESILNNLNPEWKTKFLVEYRFEEKQMLAFRIYDKDCAKYSLENHDFLGKLECNLGEIVAAPHSKLTRPLKLPAIHSTTSTPESTLSILAEEAGECKKFIYLDLKCCDIKSKNTSSAVFKSTSRKVFLNISKQLSDSSWILLHRTERVLPSTGIEVVFPTVSLRYSSVCSKGNLETPIRLQLYEVKHSFKGKSTKLIGETLTNFIEISEKLKTETSFILTLMNTQCKKEEQTDSGKIAISNFKIEQQKTFMDYMQEGLEIKFAVAIDFTASNGEPTSHSSLHYKHGKRDNPYVMTMKIVGEILQDYSSSKKFYAYGFGGKGFPIANRVNHKFPLNFKEKNPLCHGIEGILSSYSRSLQRVKLFGPTCFAPIIREIADIARNSMKCSSRDYFVLLILTDGIVCDPETTRDALVAASVLPLSVIIIGIGNEDFTLMEKFDSDEKLLKSRSNKMATRDIVQFVELRKYVNFKSITPISVVSKAALARSVLAELPQQVVSWMTLNAKKVNDSDDCANNEISQD